MATRSSHCLEIEIFAERGPERGGETQRESARGQPLVREAAVRAMRIQKRDGGQRLIRDQVMIDDDRIETALLQDSQRRMVGRTAVARDQDARAAREDPVACSGGDAVTAVEATGEQRRDLASERPEHLRHYGRAGDAVAVVVPEYGDALAGANGPREALRGDASIGHGVGRRQMRQLRVEVATRGIRTIVAAAMEPRGNGRGQVEGSPERTRLGAGGLG